MNKRDFYFWLILLGFALWAVGCTLAHYKVWRFVHPDAPGWTYIFR